MKTLFPVVCLILLLLVSWLPLFIKGKQFALRDRLQKADAIVVLREHAETLDF